MLPTNFIDVIYIPPETETAVNNASDIIADTGAGSLLQLGVAVIAAVLFAASIITMAVFAAKQGKKTTQENNA